MTPFEILAVVVVGGWLAVWAVNRLYMRALRIDLRTFHAVATVARCSERYRTFAGGLHRCRLPDRHVGRHLFDLMHPDEEMTP